MSKRTEPDLVAQLQERFRCWDALCEYGGSDPFYADGVNMNLVRNHIIYYKRQIKEQYGDGELPEIYHRPTPPEVDNDYVARSDEIRTAAKAVLAEYLADPHYKFLKSHALMLDAAQTKSTSIKNVLGYATALEQAVADDDLITMRRHLNSSSYLQSFAECEERVRKALAEPQTQLSLFSMLCDEDPGEDESITM